MMAETHLIWESDPDFDQWKQDHDYDLIKDMTDTELYELMADDVANNLADERCNLHSIDLPNGIFTCANLGLWTGRHVAVLRDNVPGTVWECLKSYCNGNSSLTFYVDEDGEFRADESHHDGTNCYWFRAWKPDVTEEQKDDLIDKLCTAGHPPVKESLETEIYRLTYRLGDLIGDIYGWGFPNRPAEATPDKMNQNRAYIALVAPHAVRDVQVCGTDNTDWESESWTDLPQAEVYLGMYAGKENLVRAEAARYAMTTEDNIRLVPVDGAAAAVSEPLGQTVIRTAVIRMPKTKQERIKRVLHGNSDDYDPADENLAAVRFNDGSHVELNLRKTNGYYRIHAMWIAPDGEVKVPFGTMSTLENFEIPVGKIRYFIEIKSKEK